LPVFGHGIALAIGVCTNDNELKTLLSMSLAALLLICSAVSLAHGHDDIPAAGSKYNNLFVFKTDRKLVGAQVEILTATGDLVTTQILQKRKIIIDFHAANFGTYTIRLTKNGTVKEYYYTKK
jgi:hypothetical protein